MEYEQTLTVIHSHGRFSGTPSLNRIRALFAALDNPQKQLRFVHVAGTNGKGSTAALTAEVLQQAGYQTGLYTSPYLMDFCERMRINGSCITHTDLCRIVERVQQAEKLLSLPAGEYIGEFEFTTACAMCWFAAQKCDIVVLEVGLGGRFDATNAIDTPEVAVMTHIALDHMAVLGNTVEEIAADKSHIVKSGTVLVNYPAQTASVNAVLCKRCADVGADYVCAPQPQDITCSITGTEFTLDGTAFSLRLIGRHQAYNAATAYEALRTLRQKGWNISNEAIQAGFSKTVVPARQEIIQYDPLLMIDGAHNLDGVTALCETLDSMLPAGGISLVLGMVEDKQYADCIRLLTRRADNIYAVQPDNPRALSSAKLATLVREFSPYCNVIDCVDTASAVKRALRYAQEEDAIIVCGSLYVAGEAKNYLQNCQN